MMTQEKINAIVEERQVDIKWFDYVPVTHVVEDILLEDVENQIEHLIFMDNNNCFNQMSANWFNTHEEEQDSLMEVGCVGASIEGNILTIFS